jgi:hypothetical protein
VLPLDVDTKQVKEQLEEYFYRTGCLNIDIITCEKVLSQYTSNSVRCIIFDLMLLGVLDIKNGLITFRRCIK